MDMVEHTVDSVRQGDITTAVYYTDTHPPIFCDAAISCVLALSTHCSTVSSTSDRS